MPTADPGVRVSVDPRLVARTRDHLAAFLRALHDAGLSVPATKQRDFHAGIEAVAPSTTGQLYWVGVATIVTSESGHPVFDEVFRRFFGSPEDAVLVVDEPAEAPEEQDGDDDEEEQGSAPAGDEVEDLLVTETSGSGLRAGLGSPELPKRFGRTSASAHAVMREIAAELPRAVPRARSRRHRPGRRRHRVDLRAVYLESRRTQGEIVRLRWRHRPTQPRRVLVLIDVSGSMKQHSPDHLRFAHTVLATCSGAEVFTFGTRLTRVTAALRHRDVDEALDSLAPLVLDADGGTLIGESLTELLADPHVVTMARGALVLVLSDGLERGDCTAMVGAVGRLSRLAHQLTWWSPLACDPAYRPLTRGMAAVVGDLDALAGVRDLETALAQVRSSFSHAPAHHPRRRNHD
ncbi:VWA domain-containing protein [Nocardioides dongxiaopingii]|uniref:vWA domain-containing protein n=1 Tax=Nocardioides sp. S-1144 TaxID=2582905 RepID=UPI00110F4856|nr:VWA domain-containing protein [Nocardioides sp. S-1144]QCW50221.1 VWA domain-containing protein [Nocardioides sp. S-1144]